MTEDEGRAVTEAIPDEPLGDHVLELQITDVVAETDDARSLVFGVPDGPDDPEIPAQRLKYSPGQFLTLRIPSDRTGSVARCYSLCSSPFTDDALTVTVKRTADGYASNWLCDHARDRKSTRLNSSHVAISYAVFCLKKKISIILRIH